MAKKIKLQNEEIRQLKNEIIKLKNDNNNLLVTNDNLKNEITELKHHLQNYCDANKNQLTPKEDFKISMPVLTALLGLSIAITYLSFKNDTNTLGYILAVISFLLSVVSSICDIAKSILHICKPKKIIFIVLSQNLENGISFSIILCFATLVLSVCYFSLKQNYDTTLSNLICSVTLIIYFLNILVNKILSCITIKN